MAPASSPGKRRSEPLRVSILLSRNYPAVYAAVGAVFCVNDRAPGAVSAASLKIVAADQMGAPTSARIIADALTGVLAADSQNLGEHFAQAGGVLNIAASGETSWHGFATAIVEGLKSRGVELAVQSIVPLRTADHPTKAKRPHNSRFDLTRLREVFGVTTPSWREALEPELDLVAQEMRSA